MNDFYNNSFGYDGSGEPDYYTLYQEQKTKEARGVFSRCHLSVFLYLLVPAALVAIAELILIAVLGLEGYDAFLTKHSYFSVILSFAPAYVIGFPILYLLTRKMKTMPTTKRKMPISEFLSLFLIAELAMVIGNLIGETFNGFISTIMQKEIVDYTSELISTSSPWLILPIAVIIGPIFEELIFRKIFIDRFSRYGYGISIVVTSIAFALFHCNFYQFFYAFFLGLILGYVYARTRNVIYPIAMHALINFFGTVATLPVVGRDAEFLTQLEDIMNGLEVDMARFIENAMIVGSYTVIMYAILGGGIAMLITYIKKRKFKIPGAWEYQIPKERRANVVFVNPGTIMFFALSVLFMLYSIIMI